MTAYANTFEGGSNGTTITTGNSGGTSGDAWDVVTIGSGATFAFDNAHAAHGSLAGKIATGASAVTVLVSKTFPGATTTPALRFYCYFTANPGAVIDVAQFRSGGTTRLRLQITTTGKVRLLNAAGSTLFTSTNSINLNGWSRIEIYSVTLDPTTGAATVALFNTPDSSTATESSSVSSANFGGSADRASYGVLTNSTANVGPYWVDDVAENDTGTAIGPAVTNVNVNGSQATTTSTGQAGTAAVAPAGQQATTTATGLAGTPAVTTAGVQASTTSTGLAGSAAVRVQGTQAVDTSTPTAGAATVTVTGGQATEADTGIAGSAAVIVTGTQAAETDSALTGTPAVTVAGSTATETDTAFHGSSTGDVLVNGSQALDSSTGAHGSAAVTVSGQQASTADTGQAGTPRTAIPGGQATETDTAFAGIIGFNWPGAQAVELDTAFGGTTTAHSGGPVRDIALSGRPGGPPMAVGAYPGPGWAGAPADGWGGSESR